MHSLILFSLTIRSEIFFSDLIKTQRNQYEYVENRGKRGYSISKGKKAQKKLYLSLTGDSLSVNSVLNTMKNDLNLKLNVSCATPAPFKCPCLN